MGDEHPNATLFRRLIEAFVVGDRAAVEAVLADDVVWHAPGTSRFSGAFQGKAAVMQRFADMRAAGISTEFEVHDVVANDEHAVALVHLHLAVEDGRRYDQPQVQVVHLRDGKVVEFWGMNQDQAVLDLLMGD
jgi:ketosteroid isomerase-like protein